MIRLAASTLLAARYRPVSLIRRRHQIMMVPLERPPQQPQPQCAQQRAALSSSTSSSSTSSSSFRRCQSSVSAAAASSTADDSDDERIEKIITNHNHYTNNNNNNSSSNNNPITGESIRQEIRRLRHIRNVGIFAHVDAGKTTVTERMLALAGVIRSVGSVDDGSTVTDYLPAERERGITIQSAAVSFEWGWHNSPAGDDYDANDNVVIHLIDTPGHVDFSVEVNRSVAVLDGAVLVVDAVAGAQAQTETVWRAMKRPFHSSYSSTTTASSSSSHGDTGAFPTKGMKSLLRQDHAHEPLPCLAMINKCDKDGCHFGRAITSLRNKLHGANPIAIQMPLFRLSRSEEVAEQSTLVGEDIVAVPPSDTTTHVLGDFVGVVDLVHMRAIVWPEGDFTDVDSCVPTVIPLMMMSGTSHTTPIDSSCPITKCALEARAEIVTALADVDTQIEECYLNEQEPSNAELRLALRRATLAHKVLPVMAGAALKGKGVEPLIDAIADLLPSPLDRMPPALNKLEFTPVVEVVSKKESNKKKKKQQQQQKGASDDDESDHEGSSSPKHKVALGHALHPSLLALAFKVVHMKGRGGSGDGRVVFARVYSGVLRDRELVQVVTPPAPGEAAALPRAERVSGMLELSGDRFDNYEQGICRSGDVCALVGLKSVVTGDTIMMMPENSSNNSNGARQSMKSLKSSVCCAGVASPKPVLTVRLEADTTEQQNRLTEALALLAVEDPSLLVEESPRGTLLSGLGELHIEVTLDRIYREFGLEIRQGPPVVAYRETLDGFIETDGLVRSERSVGGTKMQASLYIRLEQNDVSSDTDDDSPSSVMVFDPVVELSDKVREFLQVDETQSVHDLMFENELVNSLVQGCQGALKRGPLGLHAMANLTCRVLDIDSDGGLVNLQALPGALRAAAVSTISSLLRDNKSMCVSLEPSMSIEISVPDEMVGTILSDLTSRRGVVNDVLIGGSDHADGPNRTQPTAVSGNALIRGEVPLVEILGYANSLRSVTGGQGSFSAEYCGYSRCS